MERIISPSAEALAQRAAGLIADFIRANPGKLICFAAGDTPLETYAELITLQRAGELDLNSMYYAGLDEWVGLSYEDRGSCMQVMHDGFYAPAGISEGRMHVFDGLGDPAQQCRQMQQWIDSRGGIALTVLGIGMNGHIGFNEPPATDAPGCLVVDLDDTTRAVSVKYFDRPLPVEKGITVGLAELMKAQRMILMATGERKRQIVKATAEGPMAPDVPSSMLQDQRGLTALFDEAAAALLS